MARLEDDARRSWEAAAEGYRAHCGEEANWNKLVGIPAMLPMLGDVAGRRVVDVGCGQGHYAIELSRRGATVLGIEPSETMRRYAGQKAGEAGVELALWAGGGERLAELEDGSRDIVLCAMMLEHVDDITALFGQARRVLRADGFLAASVVHPVRMGSRREALPDSDKAIVVDRYPSLDVHSFAWLRDGQGRPVTFTSHHRTVEQYVSALREAAFVIEQTLEPAPVEEAAEVCPHIAEGGLRCPQGDEGLKPIAGGRRWRGANGPPGQGWAAWVSECSEAGWFHVAASLTRRVGPWTTGPPRLSRTPLTRLREVERLTADGGRRTA